MQTKNEVTDLHPGHVIVLRLLALGLSGPCLTIGGFSSGCFCSLSENGSTSVGGSSNTVIFSSLWDMPFLGGLHLITWLPSSISLDNHGIMICCLVIALNYFITFRYISFRFFGEVGHVTITNCHVTSTCKNMATRPVHILQSHWSRFWLSYSVALYDAFNSMFYVISI